MLKGFINFEGKTTADVEIAIEAALRRIKDGSRGGGDTNEDGSFEFDITGEEEKVEITISKMDIITALKKKFTSNNPATWGRSSKQQLVSWYKEHILNDMRAKVTMI